MRLQCDNCAINLWINSTVKFFIFQIIGLSRRYPGLMSLRSVDLSPASWMAVAWYRHNSLYFPGILQVKFVYAIIVIEVDQSSGTQFITFQWEEL